MCMCMCRCGASLPKGSTTRTHSNKRAHPSWTHPDPSYRSGLLPPAPARLSWVCFFSAVPVKSCGEGCEEGGEEGVVGVDVFLDTGLFSISQNEDPLVSRGRLPPRAKLSRWRRPSSSSSSS